MRGTGEGLDSLWSCFLMKCGGGDGKAPYRTRGRDGVGGYGRGSGRYGAGIIDNMGVGRWDTTTHTLRLY